MIIGLNPYIFRRQETHDVLSAAFFTQAAKASIRSLQPSAPFSAMLEKNKEIVFLSMSKSLSNIYRCCSVCQQGDASLNQIVEGQQNEPNMVFFFSLNSISKIYATDT